MLKVNPRQLNGSITPYAALDARTARVLTIDIGRRSGWAIGERDAVVESGVHSLYDEKDTDFTDSERFMAFFHFLTHYKHAVDMVVFEQVNGGTAGRQSTLYAGYRGVLLIWGQLNAKPVVPMAVSTIKKHFTGSGRGKKEAVMAECVRRGYKPFDDNEGDAIATYHAYYTKCAVDRAEDSVNSKPTKRKTQRRKKDATAGDTESDRPNRSRRKRKDDTGSASGTGSPLRKAAVRGTAEEHAEVAGSGRGRTKRSRVKGDAPPSSRRKNTKVRDADLGDGLGPKIDGAQVLGGPVEDGSSPPAKRAPRRGRRKVSDGDGRHQADGRSVDQSGAPSAKRKRDGSKTRKRSALVESTA